MNRKEFLIAGLWTVPVIKTVHLQAAAGTPPPTESTVASPAVVPEAPEAPNQSDSPREPSGHSGNSGTLAFTGANIQRDVAIGSAMIAAGALAQFRRTREVAR